MQMALSSFSDASVMPFSGMSIAPSGHDGVSSYLGRITSRHDRRLVCGGRTVVVTPRGPVVAGCHRRSCASILAIARAICSGVSADRSTRRRRTPSTS